jgi:hypothetical protein
MEMTSTLLPLLSLGGHVEATGGVASVAVELADALPFTFTFDAASMTVWLSVEGNGTEPISPIDNTTFALVITDRSKQCVTKDADVRGRGCTSTLHGTLQFVSISDCPGIATASVSSRFETSAEVTWIEPTCDRCTLVGSHQPGVRLTIGLTAVAYRMVPVSSMQAALEEPVCRFEVRHCMMLTFV